MKENNRNKFSAPAPALGYLYQCKYALYEALKRLRDYQEFLVSVETLDDVVFEQTGGAVELLQTKHHINSKCNLTDASVELWKTLRIWCERLENNEIDENSTLFLITTASVGKGTASAFLKNDKNRDIEKAMMRLNSTAKSSTSSTNVKAYTVYNKMPEERKKALLSMIYILDGLPDVLNIDSNIKKELFHAAKPEYLDSFLQRLEGWWYRQVISHLKSESRDPISSISIVSEMNYLREQFKEDNLPIDEDLMSQSVDASGYKDHIFVKQLELINIGSRRLFHAIKYYFRATEQRSRWIREDLLFVGELDRYEQKLIEEWELVFDREKDKLGKDATEAKNLKASEEIYNWVESHSHTPIRRGVIESAIARGSYQILSDSQKVGWHIEFQNRLRQLLEGRRGGK